MIRGVGAFFRQNRKSCRDDAMRVGLEESGGVETTHENPPKDSISGIHHATDSLCQVDCRARHAWRHQTDKVGLDLKVDVVGVRVYFGRTTQQSRNATTQRAAGCVVGESSVAAPQPFLSITAAKVISTYRSSWLIEFSIISGFHSGSSSSGMI